MGLFPLKKVTADDNVNSSGTFIRRLISWNIKAVPLRITASSWLSCERWPISTTLDMTASTNFIHLKKKLHEECMTA